RTRARGLPRVYPPPYFTRSGGLIAHAPDSVDQYRRAAGYVDRILKGEKPADLPVQAPTKRRAIHIVRLPCVLAVSQTRLGPRPMARECYPEAVENFPNFAPRSRRHAI